LPEPQRASLRDVWWVSVSDDDPFREVRDLIGEALVVGPPKQWPGRVLRKARRLLTRSEGARDLFERAAVDVFFPIPPCANSGTPYVFWLPDFQYLRRPDLMSPEMCKQLEAYYALHVSEASRIVLSSQDARGDFARVFPGDVDRTHVVRFCSVPDDDWWAVDPLLVASKYDLPERFLIVSNQFTRHKNHMLLVQALAEMQARKLGAVHLVCTGSTFDHRGEDYVEQVRRAAKAGGVDAQIHILGLIPRSDQIALVRRSLAVLQPSMFEGWSTIIEDAKTLGKPVLASDLPVHAEQLSISPERLLPQDDPGAWATAMAEAWHTLRPGPGLGEERDGLKGLERARHECGMAFVGAIEAALMQERN
jgi:glycosyltransferase involved in cell wall biosynthesis